MQQVKMPYPEKKVYMSQIKHMLIKKIPVYTKYIQAIRHKYTVYHHLNEQPVISRIGTLIQISISNTNYLTLLFEICPKMYMYTMFSVKLKISLCFACRQISSAATFSSKFALLLCYQNAARVECHPKQHQKCSSSSMIS